MSPPILSAPNAYHSTTLERCAWWLASLFLALFLSCLRLTTTRPFELTTFKQLVNFEAVEPFQHRVLLPAIAAGIQQIAPVGETLLFALMEVAGWMLLIAVAYRALVVFEVGRSEPVRRLLAFTVLVPMLLLGTWVGERLFGKASDILYRRIALGILLVIGFSTLFA